MIMPLKKDLLCLSKPALHFFHHPFRVVITVVGGRLPTCSQLMSLSQLALVKMQSLHKCVGVSGSLLHSLQSVSCGQPLFAKLSAVKIFFWSRSQAKKRHFGSVLAFQIGWNNDVLVRPMNWIRYALFVVYSPLGVDRQMISPNWILLALSCSCVFLGSSILNSFDPNRPLACKAPELAKTALCWRLEAAAGDLWAAPHYVAVLGDGHAEFIIHGASPCRPNKTLS